jgi:hypothetical protein
MKQEIESLRGIVRGMGEAAEKRGDRETKELITALERVMDAATRGYLTQLNQLLQNADGNHSYDVDPKTLKRYNLNL